MWVCYAGPAEALEIRSSNNPDAERMHVSTSNIAIYSVAIGYSYTIYSYTIYSYRL